MVDWEGSVPHRLARKGASSLLPSNILRESYLTIKCYILKAIKGPGVDI